MWGRSLGIDNSCTRAVYLDPLFPLSFSMSLSFTTNLVSKFRPLCRITVTALTYHDTVNHLIAGYRVPRLTSFGHLEVSIVGSFVAEAYRCGAWYGAVRYMGINLDNMYIGTKYS